VVNTEALDVGKSIEVPNITEITAVLRIGIGADISAPRKPPSPIGTVAYADSEGIFKTLLYCSRQYEFPDKYSDDCDESEPE
jgi:hypothetical protein